MQNELIDGRQMQSTWQMKKKERLIAKGDLSITIADIIPNSSPSIIPSGGTAVFTNTNVLNPLAPMNYKIISCPFKHFYLGQLHTI